MPRKKSPEGKPTTPAGVELKAVRVELEPDRHNQLRIEAAKNDESMASLVRRLILDFLDSGESAAVIGTKRRRSGK
jgi:hypothetical protein